MDEKGRWDERVKVRAERFYPKFDEESSPPYPLSLLNLDLFPIVG